MELKNGPVSFFKLLFLSFKTANQAFGAVFFLLICVCLFSALLVALPVGAAFLFGPRVAGLLKIPLSLILSFVQIAALLAVVALLGAKLEKQGVSPLQALRDGCLPALYWIVDSILLGAVVWGVLFLARSFGSMPVALVSVLGLGLVLLPLAFLPSVLVLRDEGPISALRYCFELGFAHSLRILLNFIGLGLLGLLVCLAGVCLLKSLAPEQFTLISSLLANPKMAAMAPMLLSMHLMQLPKLTLLFVIIGGGFVYLFLYMFVQAFITALFLNLDYEHRLTPSRGLDDIAPAEPPAAKMHAPVHAVTPEVGIQKASIRTQEAEDFSQHLEEVYNPQEHLEQALAQEEDRMPTILFDEEMARQLEKAQQDMQKQNSGENKQDNGPQSIKMSDKPL